MPFISAVGMFVSIHWMTYVLKHIDTTPNEDLHKLLPEEWETT